MWVFADGEYSPLSSFKLKLPVYGSGGQPQDRSVELRQIEIDAENARRAQEQEEEERRRQELAALRTSAMSGARSSAQGHFSGQGVDPTQFSDIIERELSRISSSISPDDPNPGSYYTDFGSTAYNTAQNEARSRAGREIDRIAPSGFAIKRIADTADDPYLDAIYAEQRQSADEIIKNMLSRGVVTESGYRAGLDDLEGQAPGVRLRLNETGQNTLETGRGTLRDVANEGREHAANLTLNSPFDPSEYGTRIDQKFSEFMASLGDTIRAGVPGNLFETGNLAGVAGAAQGQQNTRFDPAALAGIFKDDEEEEEDRSNTPTGSSGIF